MLRTRHRPPLTLVTRFTHIRDIASLDDEGRDDHRDDAGVEPHTNRCWLTVSAEARKTSSIREIPRRVGRMQSLATRAENSAHAPDHVGSVGGMLPEGGARPNCDRQPALRITNIMEHVAKFRTYSYE